MKKLAFIIILMPLLAFSNTGGFDGAIKETDKKISENDACTPTSKNYSLKSTLGMSRVGNTIKKISTTLGWNIGTSTNLTLTEGNYLTYGVNLGTEVMLGLSVKDIDANFTTINYAFYNNPSNKIYVFENGVNKTPSSTNTYVANGVLKIAIEGGRVKFYSNGNLIYESLYVLTNPKLVVDFSLLNSSSQINNLEIWKCGASVDTDGDGVFDQDDQCPGNDDAIDINLNGIPDGCEGTCNPTSMIYTIINPTGINQVTNQGITTISKIITAGWNAGGSSNLTLSEGNYITYKLATGNAVSVGLSLSDTNLSTSSINNSLYVDANNQIFVFENSTQKASGLGTYYTNSILKILIEGGKVKYFCNGKLIYVATTTITNPQLIVDFSMYGASSQIIDLKIYKCCIPNTITLSSSAGTTSQTQCINTAITNITYTTTGATNATVTGLPNGVTASFSSNNVVISGSPTVSGTFPYTINLTGGCGLVGASGTITVNPSIEATFENVGIIGNGTITYQLPATSSNSIVGTWNPTTLLEGEQDYIFTPNAGQCSSPVTMPFMVLKPKMILAFDEDFSTTTINGSTGGETPSVFDNDEINFTDNVTGTNTTVSILAVTPSTASFTIDTNGIITIPSGTPAGTYTVEYQINSIACPLNYDSATATIVVRSTSLARKAKPKQEELLDKIVVYPNPSSSIFNIDLTAVNEEYTTIKVLNVLGQVIYQGNLIPKSSNPINLSNSPSGYYIARVSSNSVSSSFQLIKQ